ncbi:MAG TPA: hypothetical protein VF317_06215 [Dermatophilaceae bacterium]
MIDPSQGKARPGRTSVGRPEATRDRWTAGPLVKRLPEDAELPCELAAGPLPSVWAAWEGCGRPLIADPVERLREAHRNWASAGQSWSMGLGCSRNAWVALLPADVLEQVSAEGRERAEQLARQRVVPRR